MTREEAEKIFRIMAEADGKCEVCARTLFSTFVELFPEYRGLGEEIFTEIFGTDLYVDKGESAGDDRHHLQSSGFTIMYNFGEERLLLR